MPQINADSETFILFELAGTTYGVHSRAVQQMEMVVQITPVPRAPAFVEGVVFVRGHVIPAIDLRARFGFLKIPYGPRTRLIVINCGPRTVGWIVDTAREFVAIPREALQPPPEAIAGLSSQYLEAIVSREGRLILILDAQAVLDRSEMLALSAVEDQA